MKAEPTNFRQEKLFRRQDIYPHSTPIAENQDRTAVHESKSYLFLPDDSYLIFKRYTSPVRTAMPRS
jgi:hypothetical protein